MCVCMHVYMYACTHVYVHTWIQCAYVMCEVVHVRVANLGGDERQSVEPMGRRCKQLGAVGGGKRFDIGLGERLAWGGVYACVHVHM